MIRLMWCVGVVFILGSRERDRNRADNKKNMKEKGQKINTGKSKKQLTST